MNNTYDVVIIGSGPAGYTAAIYSSRAFLKTLVISGPEPGGQLTTTTDVDNFPGFQEGIGGPALVENMKKQAERFGTEIKIETVKEVKNQNSKLKSTTQNSKVKDTFIVTTDAGEYISRSVIIATGASAKRLGIPSEEKFRGKGISYCATCDGFFFRGKNIAVLGGGDTAMEDATFLTRFATHVTIIHRRNEFRATPIVLEKAKKNEKISFLINKTVEEFYGDTVIKGIKLREVKGSTSNKGDSGKVTDFPIDGVFMAIGHQPNTAFLKDFIELDEKGYVITYQRLAEDYLAGKRIVEDTKIKKIQSGLPLFSTHTSVRGVFAAGDCVDPIYRQAIVASGMGCQAAMDAQKWLEE